MSNQPPDDPRTPPPVYVLSESALAWPELRRFAAERQLGFDPAILREHIERAIEDSAVDAELGAHLLAAVDELEAANARDRAMMGNFGMEAEDEGIHLRTERVRVEPPEVGTFGEGVRIVNSTTWMGDYVLIDAVGGHEIGLRPAKIIYYDAREFAAEVSGETVDRREVELGLDGGHVVRLGFRPDRGGWQIYTTAMEMLLQGGVVAEARLP